MASDKQASSPSKKRKKIGFAAILSMSWWILSFALSFIIPGRSLWIWIPDCLLLLGFFPLLYIYPAGWPWLLFGLLNIFIGFTLEVGYVLPDHCFNPVINGLRKQLSIFHPALTWILLGVPAALFGLMRMSKSTYLRIQKLLASKKQEKHPSI